MDEIPGNLPPPKYPNYAVEAIRLATFREWPDLANQPPEDMAKSGFYYSGVADSVRCYQCAVGLRNWDPEDDPYVEHARWSPKCPHILKIKGTEFVQLVLRAAREADIEESLRQTEQQSQVRQTEQQSQVPPKEITAEGYQPTAVEKKNPLLCDPAQAVLAMGYLPRIVKRAVDEVLKTEGWKGMKGEKVADLVFQWEENGENCKLPDYDRPKLKNDSSDEVLQQENDEMKERTMCKICCENTVSIVFLPCGHLMCCAQCSPAMKSCPVCRVGVRATVRVCLPP